MCIKERWFVKIVCQECGSGSYSKLLLRLLCGADVSKPGNKYIFLLAWGCGKGVNR
jgi:hypothetical protein